MKKNLFALAIAFCIAIALLPFTASNAAIKESSISSSIMTQTGQINIGDWELIGSNQKDVFRTMSRGDVFVLKNVAPEFQGWFAPGGRLETADKADVSMEFDLLENTSSRFVPFGFQSSYLSAPGPADKLYIHAGKIEVAKAGPSVQNFDGTPRSDIMWNFSAGYRYKITFALDGSVLFSKAEIKADGYGDMVGEFKVANFIDIPENGPYFFGFVMDGEMFQIDNFKIYTVSKEITPLIDFSSPWSTTDFNADTVDKNKVYVNSSYGTSATNLSEIAIVNPGKDHRMVTYMGATIDEKLDKTFDIMGKMELRALAQGNSAGFAFGLSEDKEDASVSSSGISYLYFENISDSGSIKTQVGMMNGGLKETPIILDSDLTTKGFFDFSISAKKDKSVTLYIDGQEVAAFENQNIEGKIAILADGAGEVNFAFKPELIIKTYTYREGNGANQANNFNTGYINSNNWETQTRSATNFKNPAEARGLVVEDGLLKFAGTSDGTHFALIGDYADYILEFDHISYKVEDRPELALENGMYTALGVSFAKREELGGWITGNLICFYDYDVREGMPKSKITLERTAEDNKYFESILTNHKGETEQGKLNPYGMTTRYKLVFFKNTITIYGVIMENGLPTGDYLSLAQFDCNDTYGKVSFSTTDGAYFAIDNVRITKIDGLDEVPADYEDFKDIADEEKPVVNVTGVTLSKAEITLNEGESTSLIATVTPTNADNKSLIWSTENANVATVEKGTITAVAEGTTIITVKTADGNFVATCVVTVTKVEEVKEKRGCFSTSNTSIAMSIIALAACSTFILVKKRK